MQDTKLFETILGLQAPWHINRVTLDTNGERVDLWTEHDETTRWPCPECQQELPCRDHAEERVWRHLDTCQYQTFLHARVPRVDRPTHGVRQVRVPWAAARSRCTVLMERLIIDLILHGSKDVPTGVVNTKPCSCHSHPAANRASSCRTGSAEAEQGTATFASHAHSHRRCSDSGGSGSRFNESASETRS